MTRNNLFGENSYDGSFLYIGSFKVKLLQEQTETLFQSRAVTGEAKGLSWEQSV